MSKELTTTEPQLKWFEFYQNNSGGYIIEDDVVGGYVFIQAYSASQARTIAHSILDAYSEYCDCCGERWSFWLDDSDGTDTPQIYGEELHEYVGYGEGKTVVMYYLNGLVDYTVVGKR